MKNGTWKWLGVATVAAVVLGSIASYEITRSETGAPSGLRPDQMAIESPRSAPIPTGGVELRRVTSSPTLESDDNLPAEHQPPAGSGGGTEQPDTSGLTLEEKYQGLSAGTLEQERAAIYRLLGETAQEHFQWRFDTGQYEVVGTGSRYSPGELDFATVSSVMMDADTGEIKRVILPEIEFPQLYEMRREVDWLDSQIAERSRAGELHEKSRAR